MRTADATIPRETDRLQPTHATVINVLRDSRLRQHRRADMFKRPQAGEYRLLSDQQETPHERRRPGSFA
jgi:hypothetical protein